MEKYHAKMAKADSGKGLAPAVTDCWYHLSGVTCWDSIEECRVRRVAGALLKGNPLNLFSQHFGQVKANANQTKANADQAVNSQNGISAYNAGVNTVQTYDKMIVGKTHKCDDVDARVRFYKRNGY
ncbi:hypothetical protein TURU_049583 [Turdus rufiventris]|nr:hypothetical protein TURU_049583 [Turdus rufiventris]